MTLIIAFILMSMVNAHWIWFPIVFVIWVIHCFAIYGSREVTIRRRF